MGKSLRSKRMRANRIRKRIVNQPKELKKLKEALAFEYNEQTENAHLSMFNNIVNGPLPTDGTYFEPSITVLEKSQLRYENFLSRKIPKIAEIASNNLVRPVDDPKKEGDGDDSSQERRRKKKTSVEDIPVAVGHGCQPTKSGSWPKWMNQRSIKTAALKRRKHIKHVVKREKRMIKSKDRKKSKNTITNSNQDIEMRDL